MCTYNQTHPAQIYTRTVPMRVIELTQETSIITALQCLQWQDADCSQFATVMRCGVNNETIELSFPCSEGHCITSCMQEIQDDPCVRKHIDIKVKQKGKKKGALPDCITTAYCVPLSRMFIRVSVSDQSDELTALYVTQSSPSRNKQIVVDKDLTSEDLTTLADDETDSLQLADWVTDIAHGRSAMHAQCAVEALEHWKAHSDVPFPNYLASYTTQLKDRVRRVGVSTSGCVNLSVTTHTLLQINSVVTQQTLEALFPLLSNIQPLNDATAMCPANIIFLEGASVRVMPYGPQCDLITGLGNEPTKIAFTELDEQREIDCSIKTVFFAAQPLDDNLNEFCKELEEHLSDDVKDCDLEIVATDNEDEEYVQAEDKMKELKRLNDECVNLQLLISKQHKRLCEATDTAYKKKLRLSKQHERLSRLMQSNNVPCQ